MDNDNDQDIKANGVSWSRAQRAWLCQVWLDSKIPNTETKYSEDGSCLPFGRDRYINDFKYYYNDNDQDVKASDNTYLSILKHYNKSDGDLYPIQGKFDNNTIQYMKKRVERYINTIEPINSKEILIPPNTYRYHVNYLFKKLIDCVEHKKNIGICTYSYNDDRKKKAIKFKLMDKNMKDAFYKFCYDNSNRDTEKNNECYF